MIHLIVQASKYLMIFLFLVYTFECFHVFKFEGEEEEQKHIYHVQRTLLFLFHFDAFLVLYITTKKFSADRILSHAGDYHCGNHRNISSVLQACIRAGSQ